MYSSMLLLLSLFISVQWINFSDQHLNRRGSASQNQPSRADTLHHHHHHYNQRFYVRVESADTRK